MQFGWLESLSGGGASLCALLNLYWGDLVDPITTLVM